MMTKTETNLREIIATMDNYKRDKEGLMEYYVRQRLDKSLQSYYHDLVNSYKTILYSGNKPAALRKLVQEEERNALTDR